MAEGENISSVYTADTPIGQQLAAGDISGAELEADEARYLATIPEQRPPQTPEAIGVAVVAYEMEPGGHICPIDKDDDKAVQAAEVQGDYEKVAKIQAEVAFRHSLCTGCVGNDCGLLYDNYVQRGQGS